MGEEYTVTVCISPVNEPCTYFWFVSVMTKIIKYDENNEWLMLEYKDFGVRRDGQGRNMTWDTENH